MVVKGGFTWALASTSVVLMNDPSSKSRRLHSVPPPPALTSTSA
jgi:hypothetical protein